MSNAPRPEVPSFAVFAKAPEPGAVKTRLMGLLGNDGAAQLHAALTVRAVETAAAAASPAPVELWCAPDIDHDFFARLGRTHGVLLLPQPGGDLGERMEAAFAAAFSRGARLVLIGADCPALTPEDLREAAAALVRHDAAFVAAEDGGYVLIALARALPLFAGMPWGTAHVMERTRQRLREAGATWCELRTLWDVDRPEDVARLQQSGLLAGAG